ncbi:MAG: site-2 protease family protein [Brevinematales bacterium]|nr:site-2 protease family protein [Brevinematales bacterium]
MEYVLTSIAILVLIISVVFHEYAHGRISYMLGDNTPKEEGRLTLNPIKHLDPVGSILLPVLLVISNTGFIIGWAKPVPINPDNYKNKKLGWILTSLAGPLTNYSLVLISLPIILFINSNFTPSPEIFYIKLVLWYILVINFVLGTFNLFPLPPLDGFWVVANLLPETSRDKIVSIVSSKYYPIIMILTIVIAIFISRYTIIPAVNSLEEWLVILPR